MDERGFSLVEVLVAVFISTSISLALLKQQWQISRIRIQIQQQNINWLQTHNRNERGLSILECMLGMTLALSLLHLLLQHYLQIKQETAVTRENLQQIARMQTVLPLLENRGHQAGFTPCLPIDHLRNVDHRNGQSLKAIIIENTPFFKITFQHMAHFVPVAAPMAENQWTLVEHWRPKSQVPIMIADCQHAEVLDKYQIQGQTVRFLQKLKYHYQPPIFVGEWQRESFWLQRNLQGKSALFYQAYQHAEELWTGVANMQGFIETQRGRVLLHITLGFDQDPALTYLIRLYHL